MSRIILSDYICYFFPVRDRKATYAICHSQCYLPCPYVICHHSHFGLLRKEVIVPYFRIYSTCILLPSLKFRQYVAQKYLNIFAYLVDLEKPLRCCISAMADNSWLCGHVTFPCPFLHFSCLLPTLRLPQLREKYRNIQGNKNNTKGSNARNSAFKSKI